MLYFIIVKKIPDKNNKILKIVFILLKKLFQYNNIFHIYTQTFIKIRSFVLNKFAYKIYFYIHIVFMYYYIYIYIRIKIYIHKTSRSFVASKSSPNLPIRRADIENRERIQINPSINQTEGEKRLKSLRLLAKDGSLSQGSIMYTTVNGRAQWNNASLFIQRRRKMVNIDQGRITKANSVTRIIHTHITRPRLRSSPPAIRIWIPYNLAAPSRQVLTI